MCSKTIAFMFGFLYSSQQAKHKACRTKRQKQKQHPWTSNRKKFMKPGIIKDSWFFNARQFNRVYE